MALVVAALAFDFLALAEHPGERLGDSALAEGLVGNPGEHLGDSALVLEDENQRGSVLRLVGDGLDDSANEVAVLADMDAGAPDSVLQVAADPQGACGPGSASGRHHRSVPAQPDEVENVAGGSVGPRSRAFPEADSD